MKKLIILFLISFALLTLSACNTTIYGTVQALEYSQEQLEQSVVIGKSNKQDVLLKFGNTLTKQTTETGETWFFGAWRYIPTGGRTEGKFAVAFNKEGIVTGINKIR